MQRPLHSPQIHHPVPQRPVQVPVMQSPPPPPHSSEPYDANPYGAQSNVYSQQQQQQQQTHYGQPGAQFFPQTGNAFFTDPMTAQMGFNVARAAIGGSADVAERNISRYFTRLKPYFVVTNTYVLRKLWILVVPWRHTPWVRQSTARAAAGRPGEMETLWLPPAEDVNAPDMYVPMMSFVTYVLLSAGLAGLSGTFHPEMLGLTASSAFGAIFVELIFLRLGCYLLSISNSQLLDLVAYSGYKFVGITISILASALIGRGKLSWIVFLYVYGANAFFLLRSLKYVLLPDGAEQGVGQTYGSHGSNSTSPRLQRKRRTWFLFAYSYLVQAFFMLLLTTSK